MVNRVINRQASVNSVVKAELEIDAAVITDIYTRGNNRPEGVYISKIPHSHGITIILYCTSWCFAQVLAAKWPLQLRHLT